MPSTHDDDVGASHTSARVWHRTRHRRDASDDARRSLPIVYLIYLAFQVDPEEVGAGGIY